MQSFFSKCAIEKVNELLPEEFMFDYTRCVRPDGTAYGTAGKCRKGVERPEEEKESQEYEDRQFKYMLEKRYSDDPDLKSKAQKVYELNQELANKTRDLDDGSTSIVSNISGLMMGRRLNDFDEVSLSINMKDKAIDFKANGDFDFGSIEEPKDRVKAALAIRNMFNTLTKAMKPGETLHCEAYDEDGRGERRKKAYEKIGFADDGKGGLVGVVQEGGGVAPPHSYTEKDGNLRDWYVAMFGELSM